MHIGGRATICQLCFRSILRYYTMESVDMPGAASSLDGKLVEQTSCEQLMSWVCNWCGVKEVAVVRTELEAR